MIVPLRRRLATGRAATIAIILSAVVALGAGWVLATNFQSSAQRDASTSPPESQPILATVATGNLVRQTTFSGRVVAENEESLTLASPTGAVRSVVTGRPVDKGATVGDGQVLTEVNGRPVFVVRSAFPFYRDVGLRDRGPDVAAIQDTLKHLGYVVEVDGEFGAQTEAAVSDWYVKNGYTPATRVVEDEPVAHVPATPPGGESIRTGDQPDTTHGKRAAYVPFSEMLGVKTLPSISLGGLVVGAAVGREDTADITLGSTVTKVVVEDLPSALTDIAQGDEVSIETGGITLTGRVASIEPRGEHGLSAGNEPAGNQNADEGAESKLTVTLIPSEPLAISDAKVRVISSQVVVGQEALLVPTIAIVDRGDGHQVVIVRRSEEEFIEVSVKVLGALDGRSAVVPTPSSSLRDGDVIRVGNS